MSLQIPVERVLAVVRDFQLSGGASLGLVAWELCVADQAVAASWKQSIHDGLLEPAGQDLQSGEDLWRISRRGWEALGVDPVADRRRRAAIDRLGLLSHVGDPALDSLARLASYVVGGCPAAVHIFDERFQHRVAAHNVPLGQHSAHDTMCRLTLDQETQVLVSDAVSDERFSGSSFVSGPEPVRFYASMPLRTLDEGIVVGTLCTFDTKPRRLSDEQVELLQDLAREVIPQIELSRLANELGVLTIEDALTGSVNRLLLTDRLQQALVRSKRNGSRVLVMVLDVDDFETINVTRGHESGDQVLMAVAERLRGAVRATDTVARFGGDQFAVIAEVRSSDGLPEVVIARVRATLGPAIPCGEGELAISVSIGAEIAQPDDDPARALARAERAMLASKR
jgi:diguanylate cyclase (GGDEF)-like protein